MDDVMWAGRFQKELEQAVNAFNSSISVDARMYRADIEGSIAHAKMLGRQGIITKAESEAIVCELQKISEEIESGALQVAENAEDIHMFVEAVLTKRLSHLGDLGKKLHTGRSRNDQVAVDIRLHLRTECQKAVLLIKNLVGVIVEKAEENADTLMPGYTHLQRAQPVTFAHHLLAYAGMLLRDIGRLEDAAGRMNRSPLGCGALAGTTHPIDREFTAKALGFQGIVENSMDGVSDRDFCIEIAAAVSIAMMHLSRFSEEIILWSSWEFRYLELDDAYATGSSMMPQKKNPDIAELVRGKTGRAYGNLITLLTVMKGLPLAYNKDMQEDKEAIFDSLDTLTQCLTIFAPMLRTAKVLKERMEQACREGFINTTDCADYLVKKGMPFRDAYRVSGKLIAYCIDNGKSLETLALNEYRIFSELFSEDVYAAVDMRECLKARRSLGGPAEDEVRRQIMQIKQYLLTSLRGTK